MKWAALALILAATAAPADPCPFSEQSRLWRQFRPLSHLLVAVTYRKECGLADARDLLAIRSLHEAQGCSAQTELGRYFTERVTAPLNETTSHPGVGILRVRAPQGYYRFCQMAELLPWPEGSAAFLMRPPDEVPPDDTAAYQRFWAHLDAMQQELTRMLTELP